MCLISFDFFVVVAVAVGVNEREMMYTSIFMGNMYENKAKRLIIIKIMDGALIICKNNRLKFNSIAIAVDNPEECYVVCSMAR